MRTQTASQAIGKQVGRARHRRGWTQRKLADAIREHDADTTLTRGAVAKIENGERKVSIDEWLLLAAALNVPPVLLLLPLGSEDVVEITPRSRIHPHLALGWVCGEDPLASSRQLPIRTDEWLEGAAPLNVWQRLRAVREAVREAERDLVLADVADSDERRLAARDAYTAALEALHEHLTNMMRAGERPPAYPPHLLEDMRKIGLDTSGLRERDKEGE